MGFQKWLCLCAPILLTYFWRAMWCDLKLGGQVLMRCATHAQRCLLFCWKLGGQLPAHSPHTPLRQSEIIGSLFKNDFNLLYESDYGQRKRKKFLMWVFLLLFSCSASGCPLASKNKALREQLSGNIKYGNGSSTTFGNRLAALSSSGNTYDPESLTQEKTSPTNDINDEKVRSKK